MKLRNAQLAFVVAAAVVVQQVLVPHVRLLGVYVDVVMLAVLSVALIAGPRIGMVAAVAAGLVTDAFSPFPIGTASVGLLLSAALVGSISEGADELPWVSAGLVAIGSIIATLGFVLVAASFDHLQTSFFHVVHVAVVLAVVNGALAPFIRKLVRPLMTSGTRLSW